jgi:hypothetical protein
MIHQMNHQIIMGENFATRNSDNIPNIETIFDEIDKSLDKSKPPAVEYIIARPYAVFNFFGIGLNLNWCGHSVVRYTMPNGESKIFNISGRNSDKLVTFSNPEEYIFTRKSDQGGIFNRDFIGIRIEDVPDDRIIAMDARFREIEEKSKTFDAKFDLIFSPILNTIRYVFPVLAERGNCAKWSSVGLKYAGVITKHSVWPKSIFIDILENYENTITKSYQNISIVSYKKMEHSEKDYGLNLNNPIEIVSPLQTFRNLFYWNLDAYAHVIVEVVYPNNHARVTIRHPNIVKKPSKIRNLIINNPIAIISTTILSLFLIKKYPLKIIRNNLKFSKRFGQIDLGKNR